MNLSDGHSYDTIDFVKKTYLVVGLGNPEGKYFQTYHNVGFLAVDNLCARFNLQFKKKGNQLLSQYKTPNTGDTVFVLKPLTYMNLSGQAVAAVARKYKIETEDIIVFTDDLYIDKGNIRISAGGSGGGHNGLRSINDILKSNKYIKIRIGIKPEKPPKNGNANYVLSKIDAESRPLVDVAIEKAVNAAISITDGETVAKMQNLYNTVNNTVSNNVENPD